MSILQRAVLVVSLLSCHLALAQTVALFPGWPTPAPVEKVARVTVDDPSIVEARISEKGTVSLIGLKEGSTHLSVWTSDRTSPSVLEVRVEAGGWDLVEVLVAAVDINEETKLTPEMVAVRKVPRAFVTRSIIRPDSEKYVLNQPTVAPVFAGDYLLWSNFERRK